MNQTDTQQLFAGIAMNKDGMDTNRFHNLLATSRNIPADTAISIYRNNYRGALMNTLELVYPVCRKIVGEQCFNGLAKSYIHLYPSTNPDLNHYGEMFSGYLQHHVLNQPAFTELPYLADLAQMEQFWHKIYYADDDPEFDYVLISKLAETEASTLHFKLSNSLEMLASDYPVYEIWNINRNNDDTGKVEAISKTDYYLIYRNEYTPVIEKTDKHTWSLLQAIKNGSTLQEILSMNDTSDLGSKLESLLPEMIKNKWVTGCYYDKVQ